MKRSIGFLSVIAVLLIASMAWAKAPIPPPPTSDVYVQDYAKVLNTETKQKLNRVGSEIAKKTKAQIVVVTVQELDEGTAIDAYGLELLRQWGIGDKALDNGVLLIIDIKGQQSRIETGYGLESALPDGKIGQIQDEYMIPCFKDGDYNRGIENTYLALAQAVMAEYKINGEDIAKPTTAEVGLFDMIFQIIAVVVIIGLIILDFMFFGGRITMLVLSLLSKRGGGGSGGGFGGGSGGGGGSTRKW